MTLLFALLLVMDLAWVETNITVSGKQDEEILRCHVCERENSFSCMHPSNCPKDFHFCTSVAVRIYPRFFYVSKQCAKYCPVGVSFDRRVKAFVLLEPMPFLYAHCCVDDLCNVQAPLIREPGARRRSRAGGLRSGGAWLAALLALSSA